MSRCIHVYPFVARNHGGIIPFSGVSLFFKIEALNLTFSTTLTIRLGDSSNESSYPYNHVKENKKCTMCHSIVTVVYNKVQMVDAVAGNRFFS